MNSLKKQLIPVLLFIYITFCCPNIVDASSDKNEDDRKEIIQKWVSSAREQYEALPDQGKFATGAVIGYSTSKLAVNSAVKFVKIAGAAFVATEVLEAAGILDMETTFADRESSESFKRKAINKIGEIRKSVRSRFDSENIKEWMKTDKMATLGAAAGAFFGFLL